MYNYGFLIDNCINNVLAAFPRKRARHLNDPAMPDGEIVSEASVRRLIAVTVNRDDFKEHVAATTAKSGRSAYGCRDGCGLLLLTNQGRGFDCAATTRRRKQQKLDWNDVWKENLAVRVTADGKVTVTNRPRCQYCRTPDQSGR